MLMLRHMILVVTLLLELTIYPVNRLSERLYVSAKLFGQLYNQSVPVRQKLTQAISKAR